MEGIGSKLTLPISEQFADKLFTRETHRVIREFNGRTEHRRVWFMDDDFIADGNEMWVDEDWPRIHTSLGFMKYIADRIINERGLRLRYDADFDASQTSIRFYMELRDHEFDTEPAFEVYGLNSAASSLIVVDCLQDNLPAAVKELANGLVHGLRIYDRMAAARAGNVVNTRRGKRRQEELNAIRDPLRPEAEYYRARNNEPIGKRRKSISGGPWRPRPNLGNAGPGRPALPPDVLNIIGQFLGRARNADSLAPLGRLTRGGRARTRRRRTRRHRR